MKKGFSLIELLVSLVIISVVVVFISAFVLNLRDEKGEVLIDIPTRVTQASISKTLNDQVLENGGISNIVVSNNGKNCTVFYNNDKTGAIQISSDNKTITYTLDNTIELVGTLNNSKAFGVISVEENNTYSSKSLLKYNISIDGEDKVEVVSYSSLESSSCSHSLKQVGIDSETELPVVRICDEEFFDITSVINYDTLVSENGNIYNYDENKTILLARYNLLVGKVYGGGCLSFVISPLTIGYGLQSPIARGKGYTREEINAIGESSNGPASIYTYVGVVPFCGSSDDNGYWYDASTVGKVKAEYGVNGLQSNLYDSQRSAAPDWSYPFVNDSHNENYSIAYYVEEYVSRLGINGTGRILTYTEAMALTQEQRANRTTYWLASADGDSINNQVVYKVIKVMEPDGSIQNGGYYFYNTQWTISLRPVIVVNTSDIQDS